MLRDVWMGACLHPAHVHTCTPPFCGCRARARRVLGTHLGPGGPLDQALPTLGNITAVS